MRWRAADQYALLAVGIHRRFSGLPGAREIASEYAVDGLLRWLAWRQPDVVYEVGGGIGTLSAAVLTMMVDSRLSYTVEEPSRYCHEQWDANVGVTWERAMKVTSWFPPRRLIEFLIVDGGDQRAAYYEHLADRAVVFWEGRRRPQRAVFEATLRRRRRSYCLAEFKPADRSKGYVVALCDPSRRQRLAFAAVRRWEAWRDWWGEAWGGVAVGKKRRPV